MSYYGGGAGWGFNDAPNFGGACLVDDAKRSELNKLGFTFEEINVYNNVVASYGKVTSQLLSRLGIPPLAVTHIKYMADIVNDKITIDSEDALVRHFKKMALSTRKIGIYDLAASTDVKMKRKCLIGGLPVKSMLGKKEVPCPFALFNSGPKNRTLNVLEVSGAHFIVLSDDIPKLEYGDSKKLYRVTDRRTRRVKYYRKQEEIPDEYKDDNLYEVRCVAEILDTNGKYLRLKIHRDYARMCGRFIIVGSLRCPDNHLGLVKIITLDGSRVYVFAKQTGWNEKEKYSIAKERIYDYGFNVRDIYSKLNAVASAIYKRVEGVYGKTEPATVEFRHTEPYVERIAPLDMDNEYSEANNDKVMQGGASGSSTNDDVW